MKSTRVYVLTALCGLVTLWLLARVFFPTAWIALDIPLHVAGAGITAAAAVVLWLRRPARMRRGGAGASDREALLRRQALIVDQMSEAVIVTDPRGGITDLNPAAEAMLGYTAEAVRGQPSALLFPAAQARHLQTEIERAVAARGRWEGELPLVSQDGTRHICETLVIPLVEEGGGSAARIMVNRDISERRAAEARMDYLAHYDGLTGLPNRVLFRDRLEQAVQMCEWRRKALAVMFFDLDNFQLINEGLGHEQGDEVLREVAFRLGRGVHQGDTLARLGGDKFALIQTGLQRAEQAAFRARYALDQLQPPVLLDGRELRVSASAGIAVYPSDGFSADALIQSADVSLSRAKSEGRNHYHFYVEGMTEQTRLRCELEHDISRALAEGEFLLHYQPQVDLNTGGVIGCEALLRWQHPELGLLLPDQFVPIAEETGAIVPIGEWCLRTVCTQVAAWRREGLAISRVAINLSPVQFSSPDLVSSVAAALQASGVPPQCLELEITETAAMQDPDGAVETLRRLNELGVHSVIDDFGTGYSSLSHLRRFPVRSLKVDQSFVTGLADSKSDGAIVSAVIDLGHSLNMRVTAEGIETEAQMQFLRTHHCDFGQGHSFARALPPSELPDYLARQAAPVS